MDAARAALVEPPGNRVTLPEAWIYPFAVGRVPGFVDAPSSGNETIDGGNLTQPIMFSQILSSPGGGSGFFGLNGLETTALVLGVMVVALVVAVAVLVRRRGRALVPRPAIGILAPRGDAPMGAWRHLLKRGRPHPQESGGLSIFKSCFPTLAPV